MTRAGGEADKVGNRYESAWTVQQLLQVVAGRARSITVEDVGELAVGSEFTLRRENAIEVHQLKRQNGTANSWTIRALASLDVWSNAKAQVLSGREYHFVSTIPAVPISNLCDRARRSGSFESFTEHWLTKELAAVFTSLSAPEVLGTPLDAWNVLRGMWFSWPDEDQITNANAAIAGQFFDGVDGAAAAAALGALVLAHLGEELSPERIVELLPSFGLQQASAERLETTRSHVQTLTANWSSLIELEQLAPPIPRGEAGELAAMCATADERLFFLTGSAGGGKSVTLRAFAESMQADNVAVLAFRLDRLPRFWSTQEMGEHLGLALSPVSALRLAMNPGQAGVLVIDQLDAVSLLSGRTPENFDAVADLLQEARAYPHMRVVLACRQFDLQNDHRIRSLVATRETRTVSIAALTEIQVSDAVNAMGLSASALTQNQRRILQSPLHLVLLSSIASQPGALNFQSTTHLFDAYWDRKQLDVEQRRQDVDFVRIINVLAARMSAKQRLAVPRRFLDKEGLTRGSDYLVSEHVLVRDGDQLSFFHEAFFDYAFARNWVNEEESLVAFLTSGEQELFRRAQVRQILTHLRDSEPERFVDELRGLLTSAEIRFHVKVAALSLLGAQVRPTAEELRLLLDLVDQQSLLEKRIWNLLRSPGWFAQLDAGGHIARWLAGEGDMQERALDIMGGGSDDDGDRLAELLLAHRSELKYAEWARQVLRFNSVSSSRALFDLLLDSVRSGYFDEESPDIWLSMYHLPESHPDWVVELLEAYLVDRPTAFKRNQGGKVAALDTTDYQAIDLVQKAAEGAPREFCAVILPYLVKVMQLTAYEPRDNESVRDHHFSFRFPDDEMHGTLDHALYASVAKALRRLAKDDALATRPSLELLAGDPHDGAQWLLFQALAAGAADYAEWAASLLLEGPARLFCGYTSNSVWATREVLVAVSGLVGEDTFTRLELAVRDLRCPWEKRNVGRYAFDLLSGLERTRLSETGRRRLGEYQRKFHTQEPSEPEGIRGGSFGSPVRAEAVAHMSDDHLLRAMEKHNAEREDWSTFTGGAEEFSHVVREYTKRDPARFAVFALRLTPEHNPAYADAILMGIGDADALTDPAPAFAAVRHIAALGHPETDRWLDMALRPYLKTAPLDIVELLRAHLVTNPNPTDDGLRVWETDRDTGEEVAQVYASGLNTARGNLAAALADLIAFDVDGSRTAVVAPILSEVARDPSVPVRTCVARLIATSLRYARPQSIAAFKVLVDTDDVLLKTQPVTNLMIYIGNGAGDAARVRPVVERMLESADVKVREYGARLACLGGLNWGFDDLLDAAVGSADPAMRKGAAMVAASVLPSTGNAKKATETLLAFFDDEDPGVREEAAKAVRELRDKPLRPFEEVLKALVASMAFTAALPQLLLTLEHAPDRVDDLALLTVQRFIELLGAVAADIRTGAPGDGRHLAQLIVRGLAQASATGVRGELLDALDHLLEIGVWGIDEIVNDSER